MKVLQEIKDLSTYQPTQGVLHDLYEMLFKESMDRVVAAEEFSKKGYKNFNDAYNKLKVRLLNGVFQNSFKDLTIVQRQHVTITKKYSQAKILYKLHKRISGVKIAEETIVKAEKMGMIEIALSLSRDMEMHFGTQFKASKKYNYYRAKNAALKKAFDQEYDMQRLYVELMYANKNNKPMEPIFEKLEAIGSTALENKEYRFRLFYHHSINKMADKQGNEALLIANTKTALDFFDSCKTPLPYTTKFTFLINLLPIQLSDKAYNKVEKTLATCLSLPNKGTYNWHLTLLYKALYGFHTNKPAIALQAWQQAHSVRKKFNSPIITERWLIIEGYISFYQKIGRILDPKNQKMENRVQLIKNKKYPKPFKLRKFLNSIENNSKDQAQRANLLVLEFLHLLADDHLKAFTEKTFLLDSIIPKYFNKVAFRRTKYFLQSIRSVVKGNFHPAGAARHANGHLQKMQDYGKVLDLNLLDKEMVGYEFLWKSVLNILESSRK